MIKFVDMFSGIGGFREGLTRAGGFECVGHCEIDKYANRSYNALFDTKGEWFIEDARKADPSTMPDFQLLCGGFPCQSFSVAGARRGFSDPRGTLFFEIARLVEARHPAYLILENVPGLLSHSRGETYATVLNTLDRLGYGVEWQNSKYALSERLVCGDCGSSYKRVTWSIHGRKQIVWRCVNRLEYGTKFCSNSPSIPETELHQAILKAVQNLAAKFTGEVADQLNGILHQIEVGESLTPQLQAQLEQNQQEFDHLLEMSLDFDENTPFLDDKLKRLSDKIKQLKTAITQSSVNSQTPSTPTNPITAKDLLITEYDDMLTARIIEKIIVKSRQDLEIIFIGGYTQQISLQ